MKANKKFGSPNNEGNKELGSPRNEGNKTAKNEKNECNIPIIYGYVKRHRESENMKRFKILSSGMKLFITFELKVFRHEERETQSFYADCFYIISFSTQPTRGTCSTQIRLASAGPESQPSSSEAGTQLTAFSQISAHASGA